LNKKIHNQLTKGIKIAKQCQWLRLSCGGNQ